MIIFFFNIGIGILLQIIIIVAYFPILKELYFKYIKKEVIRMLYYSCLSIFFLLGIIKIENS